VFKGLEGKDQPKKLVKTGCSAEFSLVAVFLPYPGCLKMLVPNPTLDSRRHESTPQISGFFRKNTLFAVLNSRVRPV
jgi:hypothetical protein